MLDDGVAAQVVDPAGGGVVDVEHAVAVARQHEHDVPGQQGAADVEQGRLPLGDDVDEGVEPLDEPALVLGRGGCRRCSASRPVRRRTPARGGRPTAGCPRARGHGALSRRRPANRPFVRRMTIRSYAAKRSASVSPSGDPGGWGSPVRTHDAKTGSTSIRATVRQAEPQVTGDCWTGPVSPARSRKVVATTTSSPSARRHATTMWLGVSRGDRESGARAHHRGRRRARGGRRRHAHGRLGGRGPAPAATHPRRHADPHHHDARRPPGRPRAPLGDRRRGLRRLARQRQRAVGGHRVAGRRGRRRCRAGAARRPRPGGPARAARTACHRGRRQHRPDPGPRRRRPGDGRRGSAGHPRRRDPRRGDRRGVDPARGDAACRRRAPARLAHLDGDHRQHAEPVHPRGGDPARAWRRSTARPAGRTTR